MKHQINSKGGSCGPAGSNTLSECHNTAGNVGFPHFLSKVNWQQWEVLPAINMSEQRETNPMWDGALLWLLRQCRLHTYRLFLCHFIIYVPLGAAPDAKPQIHSTGRVCDSSQCAVPWQGLRGGQKEDLEDSAFSTGRAGTNSAQHLQAEPCLSASPSALTVSELDKNKSKT